MEESGQYYFEKLKQHFQRETKEYLEELGKTLYDKIQNVVLSRDKQCISRRLCEVH